MTRGSEAQMAERPPFKRKGVGSIPTGPSEYWPHRSSLECSSPCHGEDRGFKSRMGRLRHGTPTGRAAKLKPWIVRVRIPPVLFIVPSSEFRVTGSNRTRNWISTRNSELGTRNWFWPCGEIGRHAVFRAPRLRAWEFDSPRGHWSSSKFKVPSSKFKLGTRRDRVRQLVERSGREPDGCGFESHLGHWSGVSSQ